MFRSCVAISSRFSKKTKGLDISTNSDIKNEERRAGGDPRVGHRLKKLPYFRSNHSEIFTNDVS